MTTKNKTLSQQGLPKGTKLYVEEVSPGKIMAEIQNDKRSEPYRLFHPDLGVTLDHPHGFTNDEDGQFIILPKGTEGCILNFGHPPLFRVYKDQDFTDYQFKVLICSIVDETCVIYTSLKTGEKFIDVDGAFGRELPITTKLPK